MRNTHSNDNDVFTFKTLGVAAARVVSELEKKQRENGDGNRCDADEAKQNGVEHKKYVDQRLREIAAFEERARGIKPR